MNPKITAISVLVVAYLYLKSTYFSVNINSDQEEKVQILYEFNFYNYTFETSDQYNQYIRSGMNKKTVLSGIKFSDSGRTFVSLPRWKLNQFGESIPATFCEIKTNQTNNPLLTPYPSWIYNKVLQTPEDALNYDYLQNVLGFEIDSDTLWIIDQAIVGGISGKYIPNTIKLLKINLTTDSIQYVYRFPENVAGNSSLLNDLVIDKLNGFIYISDPDIYHPPDQQLRGGIVVVDIKKEPYTSKRFFSGSKFTNNDDHLWLTINSVKIAKDSPLRVGVDGIALTPDNKKLVFSPLISHMIFQLDTEMMVRAYYDQMSESDLIKQIFPLFLRDFASDGILYGKNGKLYLTSLEGSGVVQWDGVRPTYLVQNPVTMVWPDAIALDAQGYLCIVTNEMHLFLLNEKDVTTRIHKIFVGSKSYL